MSVRSARLGRAPPPCEAGKTNTDIAKALHMSRNNVEQVEPVPVGSAWSLGIRAIRAPFCARIGGLGLASTGDRASMAGRRRLWP